MESSSEHECVVSAALQLAVRAARAAGVAPVRLQRLPAPNKGWRMRYSPPLGAATIAFSVTRAAATLITLGIVDYNFTEERFLTATYDHIMSLFLNLVMAGAAALDGLTASSRMRTLIQCARKIDKVKSNLNIESKRNPKLRIAVIAYIIFGITTGIDFWESLVYLDSEITLLLNGLGCLQIFTIYITLLQFVVVVVEINFNLQHINDSLSNLLLERESNDKLTLKKSAETVRKASMMHGTMCDVIEDYNRSFGGVVLATLSVCVIFITALVYVLVGNVPTGLRSMRNQLKVYLWLIYYTIGIFVILEPCHTTHCKLMCTRGLVGKLALKHNDRLTNEELHKFYQRLRLDQTSFTAMEVCSLRRSLLITELAAHGDAAGGRHMLVNRLRSLLVATTGHSALMNGRCNILQANGLEKMVATISTYLVILTQYRELGDDV